MFEVEKIWTAPEATQLLTDAGLLDLEALAERDFDWFEPPNKRRGGWSGVSRLVLNPDDAPDQQQAVFLKIQQNHYYREPAKLFQKRLTFEREFTVLQALDAVGASIPETVLFARWRSGSDQGAVLVTRALDAWLPLTDWLRGTRGHTPPDDATFFKALDAIADNARTIHDAGWVHLCYSAKHLFVAPQPDGEFRSKVIDLEKARKHLSPGYRTMKDCSHFMRHTPNLTDAHKHHFLKAYFQVEQFTPAQRRLIKKMDGAPESIS